VLRSSWAADELKAKRKKARSRPKRSEDPAKCTAFDAGEQGACFDLLTLILVLQLSNRRKWKYFIGVSDVLVSDIYDVNYGFVF